MEETLKELSDEASPGPWLQGDIVEGTTIGQWQVVLVGDDAEKLLCFMASDANFICALVNAYRAGKLIESPNEKDCKHPNRRGQGVCNTNGSGSGSWDCPDCGAHDEWKTPARVA